MEKISILIRINDKEVEKEVMEQEYDFIVETLGLPSEEISNCCGARVEEDLCCECLEHCKPIYIFG